MKFNIDPAVIVMFPHVKVGVLVAKDINNLTAHQGIPNLLRNTEKKIREQYNLEQLASVPRISDWREAYRKFGFKPSSYRSSVEALTRRVLQGKELPTINPIVDIYNCVSLQYMLPAGGDDIDHVEKYITLTIADGTERFVMLGSDTPEEIKRGEVVYRDANEVLCRSWNYRECEKSKITENTKNVCLVLEGLEHTSQEEISRALSTLRELIASHCQGNFQEFLLQQGNLEISF